MSKAHEVIRAEGCSDIWLSRAVALSQLDYSAEKKPGNVAMFPYF